MVVLHYTAMKTAASARDTLCNSANEVSAHYLIAEDGEVMSLVPEALRAWHAGAGSWGAVTDVNSHSIGVEIANDGFSPFAAPQMDALCTLLDGIKARWGIRPERVIGHSDMAPGRKIDPGARFDWLRLARLGHGVWPQNAPPQDIAQFVPQMRAFGYTASDDPDLLLSVFRMRFRPWATGPLDDIDAGMVTELARRFPVDVNATWA
ncbi:N-acetylmuramoyl-L-alanine amidase [Loktanella sp. D2R18]|uniref:N-acetylmuramoyl-L-alanine amidase n=1 Tax=Rhodobacterales TaxID=204455 RepID=UPI000DE9DB6E|nr:MULTISPECIES: N-acetylmuramoyl-L-alanine amidase [Rhodobacterales]MDO6589229.1 N-acetylmuramoyl-L-alanine amidase [Yoonia sp. 1_MG-2023]RBW45344.1 N-acetylmuramoyl-L-alanine amidase [Loktanella sp. D2R18]